MKNQNTTESEYTKYIENLWQSNSKIPFMQSKEILKYGFDQGYRYKESEIPNVSKTESSKQNDKYSKEVKRNKNEKTSKEMIEYGKEYNKTLNKQLIQEKINLTADILLYMNKHRDFIEVYTYIKQLNNNIQRELAKQNNNAYIEIV